LRYVVDAENCLQVVHGKCAQKCVEACPADAIDFDMEDVERTIRVGSIVLAPGFEGFHAGAKGEYGYGRFDNVVTSLEFERILSASGPYEGHVQRPSDGEEPKKVAWINCVGSRDIGCGNEYCSSVCCTYSIKEAIIAREHTSAVEPTIFYMDMRTYGKGFESYLNRAEGQHGVRFIRSRIAEVQETPEKDLRIRYEREDGTLVEEVFDMIVLSIGLEPGKGVAELAEIAGVSLDGFGFCQTGETTPMDTDVPGIFVCGAFSGPKDIPETVMEASGAAAKAGAMISAARDTLVEEREFVPERDVSGEETRVGVYVCHCGINIGAYVDVPAVVEYARTLPNVVHAEENIYSCSQDAQSTLVDRIKEHGLNRVLVASCTPRTHEPLFQETLREAGLNAHLFEMANIRDQCSWVHMNEPEEATEKAKDLVRMSVARAAHIESLEELTMDVVQRGLVIGGGLAGMTAALALADQGFGVTLVEREDRLGGNLMNLHYTLENDNVQEYLDSMVARICINDLIDVHLDSEVAEISGFVGNFESQIESPDGTANVEHGAIIVATGASESAPVEYLYGEDERVIAQTELERRIAEGEAVGGTIAMVQCVGSRDESHAYCSRVCCSDAIKNAIRLRESDSTTQVYILYRDMRTYGFKEVHYARARELGVIFVRYDLDAKPTVSVGSVGLEVRVKEKILDDELVIDADLVVLAPAIEPRPDRADLAKMLKVPLNEDGFFLEAHVKLRPVDFATDGIFLAGMAHSPKTMEESIAQAYAAAARASTLLAKGEVRVNPAIADIEEEMCIGCGLCVTNCPFKAMELVLKEGGRKAQVIPASCKGCGVCGASCPKLAITMKHFTNEEITAQIEAYRGVV
jgi:heterodisulfide reductase subunit A